MLTCNYHECFGFPEAGVFYRIRLSRSGAEPVWPDCFYGVSAFSPLDSELAPVKAPVYNRCRLSGASASPAARSTTHAPPASPPGTEF